MKIKILKEVILKKKSVLHRAWQKKISNHAMLVLFFYKHKSNLGVTWITVLLLGIAFLPFLCEMEKAASESKEKNI